MGLIRAFTGAAFSQIGDMWQDYIYCDSMDNNTLVQKGHARRSGGAGSDANDNIITQGSRIAVNPGQMLIIVEDGRILDFTAEQGGYEYDLSTEPSVFCGEFGESLKASFEQMRARFVFGGIAGKDQRAYFINTKDILNNRFGFGNIPYRDSEFNLTITLKGYGTYVFRISDPITFFANVSGNVTEKYDKTLLESQIKSELQEAMLPTLGDLARSGVKYDEIPLNMKGLTDLLKEKINGLWNEKRGIELVSLALSNIIPDSESIDKIRNMQESRVYSGNKAMLGARVGAAQANAMESASENPGGAVNGFVGMNMAQAAGGVNVAELMRSEPEPATQQQSANSDTWVCSCGMTNYMSFCPNCGKKKPEDKVCPKCGFVFPVELRAMRFCPNCGNEMAQE
ncbi:MAG: SPFH domain-containing protein [Lachnospiraceae bacterium]|nr:SPFH domain-containing protein [Lachnospiraceae bacterium]